MTEYMAVGPNEVAVARHGPILNHNEATGLTKVFKYLLGLRDGIKTSKNDAKINTTTTYIIESLNKTATRALELFLAASCIEFRDESNDNTPGTQKSRNKNKANRIIELILFGVSRWGHIKTLIYYRVL